MSRRILLIGSALLAGVVGLALVMVWNRSGSSVTVSFVNAEPSHGQFPLYKESLRLSFAIQNSGGRNAIIDVCAIEDEQGNWNRSSETLGEVGARQSVQGYLYLPPGSHPRSVRVRVMKRANVIQKTQAALTFLVGKLIGRYRGKQFWFDRLIVGAGEFEVPLSTGPGNQSSGSDTNDITATGDARR